MWGTIVNGVRGTTARRATVVIAGLAVIGLSFVPGWIEHLRVVMGEGPRNIGTPLSAWELESVPVVTGAVLVDGLLVVVSIAGFLRPAAVRGWWVPVLALAAIGLLAGSAWPVGQSGHASSVTLTAGWPLGLAIMLNVVILLASLRPLAPQPALLGASALALVIVAGGAMAGRTLQLNLVEGNGRHWTDGSYTRQAYLNYRGLLGDQFLLRGRTACRFFRLYRRCHGVAAFFTDFIVPHALHIILGCFQGGIRNQDQRYIVTLFDFG